MRRNGHIPQDVLQDCVLSLLQQSAEPGLPTLELCTQVARVLHTTYRRVYTDFSLCLIQLTHAQRILRTRQGTTVYCALVPERDGHLEEPGAPRRRPAGDRAAGHRPDLHDVAETLRHLAGACLGVSAATEQLHDRYEQGIDLAWQETVELLLQAILDRLDTIEGCLRNDGER